MVLSGDFRQCLPVLPNASRAEIVDRAINRSKLWQFFKILNLSENMRVRMSNDPEANEFDKFTLKMGNGELQDAKATDLVLLPENMCMEIVPNSAENQEGEKNSMSFYSDIMFMQI